MKQIIVFLGCFYLCLTGFAQPNASEPTIKSVTIFKDRAYVTRQKTLTLKTGAQTIVLSGISPKANRDSIKIKLKKTKSVDILGFRTKTSHLEKSKNKLMEDLKTKKRALLNRRQTLREQVDALLRNDQHLRSLADHYRASFSLKIHSKRWTAKRFHALVGFMAKKSTTMQNKWQSLYQKNIELNRSLELVQAKVKESRSVTDTAKLEILIDVIVKTSGSNTITVKYLITDVGWEPVYDIRLNSKTQKAELEQYAMVRQNTGENWNHVELKLSNNRSELKVDPPNLSSYVLSYQEVKKVKTTVTSIKKENTVLEKNVAASAAPKGQLAKALEVNFNIPGPQTIAFGLKTSKIFIQKAILPYSQRWTLVPAKYEYVFRRIELLNPFDFQLSAGQMQIYIDGRFIGHRWQEGVEKKSPFYLNGGVNHNLVVSYSVDAKTEKPGFIDRKKHYIKTFHSSIHNYNNKPMFVRILNQVPISEIKSVSIDLLDGKDETTKGFKRDPIHKSWIFWDVKIQPRKWKKLQAKIDVSVPKDMDFNW